jgi:hypothetical protein
MLIHAIPPPGEHLLGISNEARARRLGASQARQYARRKSWKNIHDFKDG